jgi:hypothetical protein
MDSRSAELNLFTTSIASDDPAFAHKGNTTMHMKMMKRRGMKSLVILKTIGNT